MGKIIAVAVPKGGVGKTTTAVNLAASLAAAEKRTLLIDVDPYGACSISLGFSQDKIVGDIFSVFSFSKSFSQVIHKTQLKYLDLIPSNVNSVQAEDKIARLITNVFLFRNIILQEALKYDYVIIDCPPYLKGMTANALAAANSVIIPVKSGHFSINALQKMFNHVEWIRENLNSQLAIEGILLTMYEANTRMWQLTERELVGQYAKYVFNTIIPKSSAITESTFYGKPAILFNAKAKGSVAYLKLAEEIIAKNRICPIIEQLNGKI